MMNQSTPLSASIESHRAPAARRRTSGQTLVEISVMVVMLVMLAGSLLPVIADSIASGRVVRAQHDAARIAATLANFQRDKGQPLASLASTLPVPHVLDPWGREYLVNLGALRHGHTNPLAVSKFAVFVISAGPNGVFDTPFTQSASNARAHGDDVLVRIQ